MIPFEEQQEDHHDYERHPDDACDSTRPGYRHRVTSLAADHGAGRGALTLI
ncbi:MAG: hypothetical protein ACRDRR_03615 [Pseudonocardiaceae bacterium]